mgnify:CR=1 FL=1
MKEIWKLLELLNEYSKNIWYFNEEDLQWQTKAWILSKEFWWVKWLVENDKIDNKKIADETYVKVNWEWYELILGCHYDLYQQTLMLLSISDTPIEDLISYLK